jgi:ABC-2 type transport system ATP-binding protein
MTYGLRSATVRFGDVTALDDVTISVEPGSVVAVVGGDGAGKTTLLRALVREVPLDAGSVEAPDKADLGFLPASSGSWAGLSVRQNLDFVAGIYGVHGEDLEKRRGELLAAAGLVEAADRPAAQLSGGMRRKLGFCMAMMHRPSLVVLDEPSTGVDPVSRVELWRLIAQAAARGSAVIMTTTYLDEAERAALLAVLDRGRVLVAGSYDEVRAGFSGVITRDAQPRRPSWSWRRGTRRHEYWPDGDVPADLARSEPDLEDIVIALSLARRHRAEVPA